MQDASNRKGGKMSSYELRVRCANRLWSYLENKKLGVGFKFLIEFLGGTKGVRDRFAVEAAATDTMISYDTVISYFPDERAIAVSAVPHHKHNRREF
jgi:hypothetical protein